MPEPQLDGADCYIEYAVRYVLDGVEHTSRVTASSLLDAHKQVVQQIRHHERHDVTADGYRLVRRTVTVTPWAEMSEHA